jgi:hypothetical protein
VVSGTAEKVTWHFKEHPQALRGEFVVIVSAGMDAS